MLDATIAAIATATGKAGLSVIRISGKEAYAIGEKVFCPASKEKKLEHAKGYTALFGKFILKGKELDEGVALCFRAPHSYTGEDVVELSCHGGLSVTESLLKSCFMAGAHPASPGEFTQRAVMNGRISLTQAEAVMDMIDAESRKAASLAKSAMEGTLFRKIQEIKHQLLEITAHLAAWVDYPEEGVEPVDQVRFVGILTETVKQLSDMIERYDVGNMIRNGIKVAIIGFPNVGKSTLFNLLTGAQSAIVTPVAGTTRDVIRQRIEIDGVMLQLADTAGLHETEDVIEKEGIRRSKVEIETADIVMAVFDGSHPLDEQQWSLAKSCQSRPALGVINKSDLGNYVKNADLALYFTRVMTVSAFHDNTLNSIGKTILEILEVDNVNSDSGVLANQRQLSAALFARDALREAGEALAGGLMYDAAGVCVEDALRWLATLTGEDASESVIAEIFEKFCVGK